MNLISNAIKFSPKDSVIVFDVKTVDDFVEIGISDTGPGIAPEQQTFIFNRFQQAGIAPGKAVKSTGLGLAIVDAIIKEHGGSTGVESVVGKGSRFWVRVPRMIDDEEAP
jgi:signal transduction histidine kinase